MFPCDIDIDIEYIEATVMSKLHNNYLNSLLINEALVFFFYIYTYYSLYYYLLLVYK